MYCYQCLSMLSARDVVGLIVHSPPQSQYTNINSPGRSGLYSNFDSAVMSVHYVLAFVIKTWTHNPNAKDTKLFTSIISETSSESWKQNCQTFEEQINDVKTTPTFYLRNDKNHIDLKVYRWFNYSQISETGPFWKLFPKSITTCLRSK